jgi:quinol monooxygenase YgiN
MENFSIEVRDLDPRAPFLEQLFESAGPITVQHIVHVPPGKMDEAIATWKVHIERVKQQRGLLSVKLSKGIGSSNILVSLATWQNTHRIRSTLQDEDFQKVINEYPAGAVVYSHVLQHLAEV